MESRAFLMLPLVNCCLLTFVDVVESIVKCFNNNQPSHIPAIQRFTHIHIHMISVRNTVERNLTQSWCRRGLIAVSPRLCIWFENTENTLQQQPRGLDSIPKTDIVKKKQFCDGGNWEITKRPKEVFSALLFEYFWARNTLLLSNFFKDKSFKAHQTLIICVWIGCKFVLREYGLVDCCCSLFSIFSIRSTNVGNQQSTDSDIKSGWYSTWAPFQTIIIPM